MTLSKKKNKKQKQNRPLDIETLEQQARAQLDRGRFRQACDVLKALNKQTAGRYDALLAEAYQGRFDEFLDRGMHEPAEQILTNLQPLLPDAQLESLRLRLALARDDLEAVAPTLWEQLTEPDLPPEKAAECCELLMFLDGDPPEPLKDHPEVHALVAARKAFQAVCSGDGESLAEAFRQMPRSSQVADWKILLKGLEAWYQGDDARVAASLERLPKQGIAGRLAGALRCLHDSGAAPEADPNTLSFALTLGGVRDAEMILEIDRQAAEKSIEAAFNHAYKRLPGFLQDETGAAAAVTDYFMDAFRDVDGTHRNFQHKIGERLMDKQFKGRRGCRLSRTAYIDPEGDDDVESLFLLHELYEARLKETGSSDAVLARLNTKTAQRLFKMLDNADWRAPPYLIDDGISLLEHARSLDPGYVDAGLTLAQGYVRIDAIPKRNRLLDDLADQFPGNVEVLLLAGKRCLDRKAYARAEAHLTNAARLDPANTQLKRARVDVGIHRAVDYYRKGKLDRARKTLDSLHPYLVESRTPPDSLLERRWIGLWRIALEERFGDATATAAAMEDSAADWQDNLVMRVVCLDFYRRCVAERKAKLPPAFPDAAALLEQLEPVDVAVLMHLKYCAIQHLPPGAGDYRIWQKEFDQFLKKYLQHVKPERLSGVLDLLWACLHPQGSHSVSPADIIQYVRRWSKIDRSHPQLKLLHLSAESRFMTEEPEQLITQLDKATEEARKRNDTVALRHAERLRARLNEMQRRQSMPPPPDFEEDDDFEDDFEDDDDNRDFDSDELGMPASPEIEAIIDTFYEAWTKAPAAGRRSFEREFKSKFGPAHSTAFIKMLKEREQDDARKAESPKATRYQPELF